MIKRCRKPRGAVPTLKQTTREKTEERSRRRCGFVLRRRNEAPRRLRKRRRGPRDAVDSRSGPERLLCRRLPTAPS